MFKEQDDVDYEIGDYDTKNRMKQLTDGNGSRINPAQLNEFVDKADMLVKDTVCFIQ